MDEPRDDSSRWLPPDHRWLPPPPPPLPSRRTSPLSRGRTSLVAAISGALATFAYASVFWTAPSSCDEPMAGLALALFVLFPAVVVCLVLTCGAGVLHLVVRARGGSDGTQVGSVVVLVLSLLLLGGAVRLAADAALQTDRSECAVGLSGGPAPQPPPLAHDEASA